MVQEQSVVNSVKELKVKWKRKRLLYRAMRLGNALLRGNGRKWSILLMRGSC